MDMIHNLKVYGLIESMIASSYPMLEAPLSEDDFDFEVINLGEFLDDCIELHKKDVAIKDVENENLKRAYKHYRRCLNLGNVAGSTGHDCFAKGVKVQFDLTASHVFMPQFMRYHFQDIISSMSKMHRILKMNLEDACHRLVRKETIENLNKIIAEYNENPSPEKFEEVVMNTPLGLRLTARVELNYLQLKTMYLQRKNHKMSEWHEFLDYLIANCPLFEEICLKNLIKE